MDVTTTITTTTTTNTTISTAQNDGTGAMEILYGNSISNHVSYDEALAGPADQRLARRLQQINEYARNNDSSSNTNNYCCC